MESNDRERILKALLRDMRLKRLYEEHCKFEEQLQGLKNRPYLTLSEETTEKLLKKKKLAGVDQMMAIVSGRRQAA